MNNIQVALLAAAAMAEDNPEDTMKLAQKYRAFLDAEDRKDTRPEPIPRRPGMW